jgi:hypothetical protein
MAVRDGVGDADPGAAGLRASVGRQLGGGTYDRLAQA